MLKDENTRLRVLAEHDWLTGLYNRRAAEAHVDEALLKNGGGVLLVLDIDHFKQVNDRYGHLIGDALLCEAARTLRDIFFPRDIIGRVGGDEFIIYILGGCSQEAVDGRAAQLAERLRKAGRRYGMQWNLSFTLGLAEKQARDDYISLFDRADQMLLARKKARRARRADSADAGGERSICTDMALIRRELREKDPPKGAFCQDYETFKQIYRFVERGLKRSGQSAYIILMTLTDAQGQFVPLAAREEYMSRLSDDLQASLRSGDLFAPYSGCQYLLMVLGASSENAAVIAGRIHTRFMSRVAPDTFTESVTVQVLQPNTIARNEALEADQGYTGYVKTGTEPAEVPAVIENGATITVNYGVDESQTKTLSYTVNYYKDGEFVENISVEQTVQVLQPDTLTVQPVDTSADRYEGFTFDYTSPAEIPAVIAHEGEINVYYATDEKGGEDGPDGIPDYAQIVFTYQSADVQKGTVDKSVEIHTFERLNGELLEEKKASPAGANAAGREGYAFDYWTDGTKRDVTSGMETLKSEVYTDNAEFTAYFDVDTKGTDPENPDKPDNVPDKYQAKVTYQAVNGAVTLGGSTGTELVTYVTLFDADGKWAENGTGKLAEAQVPTAAAAADYDPATERWTPAVPAEGAEITADGAVFTVTWELAISGYQVHYYYDGVEDTASAVNATGKIGDAIPYDTGKTTFDGANYVLENVDGAGKLISKDAAANIVNVNFTKDEKSDPTKDPDPEVPGDNIPDKYQATVTFEAINGVLQPKGGTDAQNTKQMTTVVTLLNENGEPAENGTGYLTEAQIPTALANLGYIANTLFWGPATPTTSYAITGDITFVADFNAEGVIPEEPPVPPVTPVGPTAPEEGPEETIDEPETPLAPAEPEAPAEEPAEEEIEEADTPLASGAAWALLNLILMLCTALVSILLLIGFLGKKKKEDENENVEYTVKRKGVTRVLSLIPAIGSIIAFLLTENMRNPMVFVDRWTWLMVLIALVQVIVCIFARKEKEEPDDNAQTPAQA